MSGVESERPLTAAMNNLLAWRVGPAVVEAMKDPAGDYIDRGLALRRHLATAGFAIVEAPVSE